MKTIVISNSTEGGFDIRLTENDALVLKSSWAASRQSALICAQQIIDEAQTIQEEFGEPSEEISIAWRLEEKVSEQTLHDISELLNDLQANAQMTLNLTNACKNQAVGNPAALHSIFTALSKIEYELHRCNEQASLLAY